MLVGTATSALGGDPRPVFLAAGTVTAAAAVEVAGQAAEGVGGRGLPQMGGRPGQRYPRAHGDRPGERGDGEPLVGQPPAGQRPGEHAGGPGRDQHGVPGGARPQHALGEGDLRDHRHVREHHHDADDQDEQPGVGVRAQEPQARAQLRGEPFRRGAGACRPVGAAPAAAHTARPPQARR